MGEGWIKNIEGMEIQTYAIFLPPRKNSKLKRNEERECIKFLDYSGWVTSVDDNC